MTPDSDPWSEKIRRARGDRPPAVDLSALLRAARAAAALPAAGPEPGIFEAFAHLFATPPALVAVTAVAALVAYLGYDTWQQFGSWADVAISTLGVAS